MKIKYERLKANITYRLLNGTKVPGTTTIIDGTCPKPQLVSWANKMGLDGVDIAKVKQQASDVGSCFHFMAQCHVSGNEPDLSSFAGSDIDRAETCFIKFLDFWHDGGFSVVATEYPLVHSPAGFGGTLDCVAVDREGLTTLIDYKTSKRIYKEYFLQVAGAYSMLWDEADIVMPEGVPVVRDTPVTRIERRIIFRVGKEDVGDFEVCEVSDEKARDYMEEWKLCLNLYPIRTRNKSPPSATRAPAWSRSRCSGAGAGWP